jgi:hypothetical protein
MVKVSDHCLIIPPPSVLPWDALFARCSSIFSLPGPRPSGCQPRTAASPFPLAPAFSTGGSVSRLASERLNARFTRPFDPQPPSAPAPSFSPLVAASSDSSRSPLVASSSSNTSARCKKKDMHPPPHDTLHHSSLTSMGPNIDPCLQDAKRSPQRTNSSEDGNNQCGECTSFSHDPPRGAIRSALIELPSPQLQVHIHPMFSCHQPPPFPLSWLRQRPSATFAGMFLPFLFGSNLLK